jgi:hypothetical protein
LCNIYEGFSEIKSSRRDTYNRQHQTFSQKSEEFLDDCFDRFEFIVISLRSCGPLVYSDNECAKQLLYALDDSKWDMKITTLEEYADFTILNTEKLFSKLKYHKLSKKIVLIMMLDWSTGSSSWEDVRHVIQIQATCYVLAGIYLARFFRSPAARESGIISCRSRSP